MAVTALPEGVTPTRMTVTPISTEGDHRYQLDYTMRIGAEVTPRFVGYDKMAADGETPEMAINAMIAQMYDDLDITPPV